MYDVDDATMLSLLFHQNSEPWRNARAYTASPYLQTFPGTSRRPVGSVALPQQRPSQVLDAIGSRRSVRRFADVDLALADLADVLHAGYGIVSVGMDDPNGVPLRRSTPSAGGTYPLELFVRTRRVEGVADGLHAFSPLHHRLDLLGERDGFADLADSFYAHEFFTEANAVVLIASHFDRTQATYGPRGYRYILLEAGHAAQNMCLMAAERGLATLPIGGYQDHLVVDDVGLDPRKAGIVYALALGTALSEP